MVLDVVADDLHAGGAERPHRRAEHVEVAGERRVGDVVDARVERDRSFALRAHRRLHGCEHVGIRQRKRAHVVA